MWLSGTKCSLQEIEASYKASNPYHNSMHAADVVQGLASLFAQNSFMAQLTDLEMLSMILSCAMHDAGHPGTSSFWPRYTSHACLLQSLCLHLSRFDKTA